jgi:hypothetical protein
VFGDIGKTVRDDYNNDILRGGSTSEKGLQRRVFLACGLIELAHVYQRVHQRSLIIYIHVWLLEHI